MAQERNNKDEEIPHKTLHDPANLVRRVSSPIMGIARHSFFVDDKDLQIEKIQKWIYIIKNTQTFAKKLAESEHLTLRLKEIIAAVENHKGPTQDVVKMLGQHDNEHIVNQFLMTLPKDSKLLSIPRHSRSPRSFLCSIAIRFFPDSVISESAESQNLSNEALHLKIASAMLVTSTKQFIIAIEKVRAKEPGALANFLSKFSLFRFSRRYFSYSFDCWRKSDIDRMVIELSQSYAEAFTALQAAHLQNIQNIEAQAMNQCTAIRNVLIEMIGKEKTDTKLQDIETFVRTNTEYALQLQQAKKNEEIAKESDGWKKEDNLTEEKKKEEEIKRIEPDDSNPALQRILRNEGLAHELILNPEKADLILGKEEELQNRQNPIVLLRETIIQFELWDPLVLSLTPAEQNSKDEIVVGSKIQVWWGINEVSKEKLYAATVISINNEDNTLTIRYDKDNSEATITMSQVKLKSDPLDFSMLLSLLDEIKQKLIALTPSSAAFVQETHDKLDLELIKQILQTTGLDTHLLRSILSFVVERILLIEAPIRTEATKLWLVQFENEIQNTPANEIVKLIPKFFKFSNEKIDQIQRDVARFQLQNIVVPYLVQNGIEFERNNFERKLQMKAISVGMTESWLKKEFIEAINQDQGIKQRIIDGHSGTYRLIVAKALINLLQSFPIPLTRIPETLQLDTKRMIEIRNGIDATVLMATITAHLRQVLMMVNATPNPQEIIDFNQKLEVLLTEGNGRLTQIVTSTIETAKAICISKNKEFLENQANTLGNLIEAATDPSNRIFSLYSKRIAQILCTIISKQDGIGNLIAQNGLEPFREKIFSVGKQLLRFFEHNLNVHATRYTLILKKLATEEEEN